MCWSQSAANSLHVLFDKIFVQPECPALLCILPPPPHTHTGSKALGLELRAKWMLAAVRLARQEDGAWRNPTMQLMVQPLGFL